MANRQPTTLTPAQLLSRPQPTWQPLTAQGQLNTDFVMELPIWQERGIAPGLIYTPPPPPPPPPRMPPPPPAQHQQQYAAPAPAAAAPSAAAGYTSVPATAPRPVPRPRVASSPRKAAAPTSAAAPAPDSGKPYGTRSKTVAHPVSTLSLAAAQQVLAETFNRDPHRVICPLAGCEKVCASPGALQQHVLWSHVAVVHACARCTKIFKTAGGLADHSCHGRYH